MAEAVISVVAERVTALLEEQIRYQVDLVRGIEEKVLDLSNKLETIRNVLDDAEKRGANDQSVGNWLKKLEDTAYEMDDILDEWNYALLKHKIEASPKQKVWCSFIPSSCVCMDKVVVGRHTVIKIQNVITTLDQILKEKDDFNLAISISPVATDHRVQSTSSIELEKVHGVDRDRNKDDIVRKLRVENDDIQVLSIVGMGGIGKTTLAQRVYNDNQVKHCFKIRIWICVSHPFDVAGIARGIAQSVTNGIIPPNINQLELVLNLLIECISGKKFLLVLDDVWTEDSKKWELLKINLKYGARGSKILVTTRNERVAKIMDTADGDVYRPQQLSDEECWLLLRRISLSGRSEEERRKLEHIGKEIARKCNGLPLAANVLGSLLQFKNSLEEWENVSRSEIWQLKKVEVELFPHLVLSYNELSPALKRCFSYCAVYPKASQINAERLIEDWMAQGYLGSVTGNEGVELQGREYLNNLAMRCLFQDIEKSGEQIEWCTMHAIVHDFAQFLRKNNKAAEMRKRSCQVCDLVLVSRVQQYRSLLWDQRSPPNLCDCLTSLRVLRFNKGVDGPLPQGMEKLIHLRCLGLSGTKLSNEDLKIIYMLYQLQTLLLAYCFLGEISGEIGNLVNLRHLDLSGNVFLTELPESMCSLVELQILNIEGCNYLDRLPEGIHKLQNLQHLLIEGTLASDHLPQGVGQLSGLRTLKLSRFKVGSDYNKLGLLKNLNRLTGSLTLVIHLSRGSDVEELVEDAREAELRNKIQIDKLVIEFKVEMDEKEWSLSSSSSSLQMEVIEALEPNIQILKKLEIRGYKGSRLAHWISSPQNFIKEITLFDLSEVCSLPPMGKLPLLEVLFMGRMKELNVVGREFLGMESSSDDVVAAFPKLKQLKIEFCSKWWKWEDITAEEEESTTISIMPCLTHLTINWCGGLKKLPRRLLRKASSLKFLDIKYSSELKKRYGY